MGYFTIRLYPNSSIICTIILPWGKYLNQRLPMGIAGLPDIFQEKMSGLMGDLKYVRTYLDDLLILTRYSFADHLSKLEVVLERLLKAGLCVNAESSTFCAETIEYLWYLLTRGDMKPLPKKVSAKLALKTLTGIK